MSRRRARLSTRWNQLRCVQIAAMLAAARRRKTFNLTAWRHDHRLHMQIAPNPGELGIERLSVSWLTPSAAAQGG